MKIGRSSIPVNVPTPYTRVGHCDDARWVSASVLVSLISNELAQTHHCTLDKHTVALVPHPRTHLSQAETKLADLPNKKVVVFEQLDTPHECHSCPGCQNPA